MREIVIYTWGSAKRNSKPADSEKNFNVCGVSSHKPHGVNLKKCTGLDREVQIPISKSRQFPAYEEAILSYILANRNVKAISINCQKGRHRSVAVSVLIGNTLAHKHGIAVTLRHLDI